jgi:Calcium-activated chloride channel
VKVKYIIDHFPLHDDFRSAIIDSWEQNRTKLFFSFIFGGYVKYFHPINFIANYYGEKMGFYFAWLVFYTSWLLVIGVPGIALFIYQMNELRK